MSNRVTEEMISALIDGELSPEDRALVENAISADESLRRIYDSFRSSGVAVKEASAWVQSSVSLPVDFTSRVMAEIEMESDEQTSAGQKSEKQGGVVQPASSSMHANKSMHANNAVWSVRTLVEVVAAVAAVIIIVIVWQGQGTGQGSKGGTAKQDVNNNGEIQKPKNGVHALGSKDGNFKKVGEGKGVKENPGSGMATVSSRKFSVFVNAETRPSIDRFWILNDYEVNAPKGTDPKGDSAHVNVLLIDAKKDDALKFFGELNNWDAGYQVFQQAKSGNASWLAPFDVAKAGQTEGDFWTLQIVLIKK